MLIADYIRGSSPQFQVNRFQTSSGALAPSRLIGCVTIKISHTEAGSSLQQITLCGVELRPSKAIKRCHSTPKRQTMLYLTEPVHGTGHWESILSCEVANLNSFGC